MKLELFLFSDEELEDQRSFLLRSLEDLDAERDAGDVEEEDFATLRDGYTARAAAVLRELDARRSGGEPDGARMDETSSGDGRDEDRVVRRRRPRWRRPVTVGGLALFAIAAGLGVAAASGQRLPGDSATGTIPNSKVQQQLALAVQDFRKGDVLGAIRTYDAVLATDPSNAEALTYKGWLLRLAGAQTNDTALIGQGLSSIQAAERIAPTYPDPHFFAGEILLRDDNDPKGAITEFQTYLADNPPSDMGPEVRGELQAAQAALDGKPLPGEVITPAGSTTPSTTVGP